MQNKINIIKLLLEKYDITMADISLEMGLKANSLSSIFYADIKISDRKINRIIAACISYAEKQQAKFNAFAVEIDKLSSQ